MVAIDPPEVPGGDAVSYHNVAESREVAGYEGVRLQRVPESVRRELGTGVAAELDALW